MKSILHFTFNLLVIVCLAQEEIVYIPDSNFKNWLVTKDHINTNGDEEIQYSEAEAFTGNLGFHSPSLWETVMADATGIEAFINITSINFSPPSELDHIDLSANTLLEVVQLENNELISVNLSNNLSLERLFLDYNNLTEVDLSNNLNLNWINLSYNNLTQVNLANGNNANVGRVVFLYNPNLTCVQVDPGFVVPQPSGETTGWWYDDYSVFSYDCWQEDLAVAEQTKATPNIQLYPNPTQDMVHIKSDARIKSVSLYDMQGKHIKTVTGLVQISVADLPSGVYVVKVVTEKGIFTEKIIKE